MVPLAKRQAVCFGIMSYNGQVNFGLIGDYEAMADLDSLAHDLSESLAELKALAPDRGRSGEEERKPEEARRARFKNAEVSLEIREARSPATPGRSRRSTTRPCSRATRPFAPSRGR